MPIYYDDVLRDFLTLVAITMSAVMALLMFLFWPRKKSANDLHVQRQLDEINGDFEAGRISYEEFQRLITEAKSALPR